MTPTARLRSRTGSQWVKALARLGNCAGLAGAEEKLRHEQRGQVPDPTRRRGEEGPEQHDAREHLARPDQVAEPAAGNLEQGVGRGEGREDVAHLHAGQAQVGGDRDLGLRHAGAVHKGDDGQRSGHGHHPMAGVGGRGCVTGHERGRGHWGDGDVDEGGPCVRAWRAKRSAHRNQVLRTRRASAVRESTPKFFGTLTFARCVSLPLLTSVQCAPQLFPCGHVAVDRRRRTRESAGTMTNRQLSRRDFIGASALGALAGASVLANPVRAAADAVGIKPSDLPDLTIKEVKVYVAEPRRSGIPPHQQPGERRDRLARDAQRHRGQLHARQPGARVRDGWNTRRDSASGRAFSISCRRWWRAPTSGSTPRPDSGQVPDLSAGSATPTACAWAASQKQTTTTPSSTSACGTSLARR
jgi:hypothetical protein